MVYGIKGSTLHQVVLELEFLSVWIDRRLWGSSHQDHGLGWACRHIADCEVVFTRVSAEVQKCLHEESMEEEL